MVPVDSGEGPERAAPTPQAAGGAPWGAIALVALAVIGLGLASYLTAVHYAPAILVCSDQGLVNCQAVLTSPYSVIPGTSLPITVPGLAYFLVSLVLALAQLRRPANYGLRQAHAVWGGLGLLTALYLIFVELVELHNICLWCSTVHLVLLVTFLVTLWRLYPKPSVR
jgi:uncharacterized membrane protein